MIDPKLKEKLSALHLGDHSCFLYKNKEEQLSVVVPFLIIGLERNERTVFLADAETLEMAKQQLAQEGIDVAQEIKRGALNLISDKSYLANGKFIPQDMLRFLEAAIEGSLKAGFSGLRATGDVLWEVGEGVSLQEIFLYEAMLDYFFDQKKLIGLCQYCIEIPPKFIRHSIYTHPNIVLNSKLYRNHSFYNPARPYVSLPEDEEGQNLQEMYKELTREN